MSPLLRRSPNPANGLLLRVPCASRGSRPVFCRPGYGPWNAPLISFTMRNRYLLPPLIREADGGSTRNYRAASLLRLDIFKPSAGRGNGNSEGNHSRAISRNKISRIPEVLTISAFQILLHSAFEFPLQNLSSPLQAATFLLQLISANRIFEPQSRFVESPPSSTTHANTRGIRVSRGFSPDTTRSSSSANNPNVRDSRRFTAAIERDRLPAFTPFFSGRSIPVCESARTRRINSS